MVRYRTIRLDYVYFDVLFSYKPFIQYSIEGFRARNNQTDNTKIIGI